MRRDFGRGDYKGWELVPTWGKAPAFKLEWNARRGDGSGDKSYAGPFNSRAEAEKWIDDHGVGLTP